MHITQRAVWRNCRHITQKGRWNFGSSQPARSEATAATASQAAGALYASGRQQRSGQ
jgi:hypothetical protein